MAVVGHKGRRGGGTKMSSRREWGRQISLDLSGLRDKWICGVTTIAIQMWPLRRDPRVAVRFTVEIIPPGDGVQDTVSAIYAVAAGQLSRPVASPPEFRAGGVVCVAAAAGRWKS